MSVLIDSNNTPLSAIGNYKLAAKSLLAGVAHLSSTQSDVNMVFVANQNETYSENDSNNAFVMGATSEAGTLKHTAYIAIKEEGVNQNVATFSRETANIIANTGVTINAPLTTVHGNLVPNSDLTHDLGAVDKRWKELYLSGQSIFLGDSNKISVNGANGTFTFGDINDVPKRIITTGLDIPYAEGSTLSITTDSAGAVKMTGGPKEINLSQMSTETMIEHPDNLFFTYDRAYTTAGKVAEGSNVIAKTYTDTVSNAISENLQGTSNVISNRITKLTTDNIAEVDSDSTINRFIVSDHYNRNLTVDGKLVASNLEIIGEITEINTQIYTAEVLEIRHDEGVGAALTINHHAQGNNQIMELWNHYDPSDSNIRNIAMQVLRDGNVGFGIEARGDYLVDINGDAHASNLTLEENATVRNNLTVANNITSTSGVITGIGSGLRNVYMTDRNSDLIPEGKGSNFYYTIENRTGMSNYVAYTSNSLLTKIDDLDLDKIAQGVKNRYIVDDVYNSDLYVGGKLIVTGIEIVELDYIFSQYDSNILDDTRYGNLLPFLRDLTDTYVQAGIDSNLSEFQTVVDGASSILNIPYQASDSNLQVSLDISQIPFKTDINDSNLRCKVVDISINTVDSQFGRVLKYSGTLIAKINASNAFESLNLFTYSNQFDNDTVSESITKLSIGDNDSKIEIEVILETTGDEVTGIPSIVVTRDNGNKWVQGTILEVSILSK